MLALPTLPISRRGDGHSPFGAPACGQGQRADRCPSDRLTTPSSSDLEDSCRVTVKNTFIDVSPAPSDVEDWGAEPRGAWSCKARLLDPSAALPGGRLREAQNLLPSAEQCEGGDGSESEGGGSGSTPRQPAASDGTPWGDSPVARAAGLLPGPAPPGLLPGPAPRGQAAEMTLQIPLRVGEGHPLSAGVLDGLKVEVTVVDGKTVISLRVDTGHRGDVALDSLPFVTSAGRDPGLLASAGGSQPAPPGQWAQRSSAASRKAASRRAQGEKDGKSIMVCCHWKNKGWCRYQDTCKFQHPAHKRGAGLPAGGLAPPQPETRRGAAPALAAR